MSIPASALCPPALVVELAAGRDAVPVWTNEIGGVTWRIGDESYLKVGPPHEEFQPAAEAARLEWLAAQRMPVPRVLGFGTDDGQTWLHTAALPGANAITCQADPAATVAALGRGLRRFHDGLPVDECPFDFSVESRVSRRGLSGFDDVPPLDLVVCHGDACNPNFLVEGFDSLRSLSQPDSTPASPRQADSTRARPRQPDSTRARPRQPDSTRARPSQPEAPLASPGRPALEVTGYVDLGLCGVADRWADLVMAVGSLRWNFPDVDAMVLLDAYGVEPDPRKLAFYDALWRAE